MSTLNLIHKHIVAALAATVMITLPLMAQDAVEAATIDDLFAQLQAVPSESAEQSTRIIDKISAIWAASGSASMDLLLKRGYDAQDAGDMQAAIDHFSALVDHAPEFPEGYHARASAYFDAGYFGPALADLRVVLALNPRHFKAMIGLATLQEATGKPEKALQTYRRILELSPNDVYAQTALSRLEGMAL